MFNRLGLRSEIVLQLSLLMGASIIFVSLLIMKVSEQELLQQRIQHSTSLLTLVATNLKLTDRSPEEIGLQLQQALHQFQPELGMKALAILGSRQSLYQATTEEIPNWPDKKEGELARLSRNMTTKLHYRGGIQTFFGPADDYLLVTLPTNNNSNQSELLQAYFSLADIRSLAYQAHSYLLPYILLIGLTLVLFGSYLLGKVVVRPIKALQQASENIAAGNLEQSVSTVGPKEIYQLTVHFNQMSQALQTSRKETEAHILALEQTNHKLEQARNELVQSEKMASIGHLAAGIAHEIGNPLGALIGYLEFLKGQAADQSLAVEILNSSLTEAGRIDRLVRDLLDYARPETTALTPVSPLKILQEVIQQLDQQKTLASHRLQLQLPQTLPRIAIGSHRLQQVFINLLLNARDASDPLSPIKLTAGSDDHQLWLDITDQGQGIATADLPHLFDPFFTTKDPGAGRGLGLFVSHQIITDAGGQIEVTSRLGQGTTFRIQFPAAEEVQNEA